MQHKVIKVQHANGPAFVSWIQKQESDDALMRRVRNSAEYGYSGYAADAARRKRGLNKLANGNPELVREAQQMLDKLHDLLDISVPVPHWESYVYGSRPNVGAYLSGHPFNMRRRVQYDALEPIRVWVNVASDWRVPDSDIWKRGVAVIALALALSERRTVTITPYHTADKDRINDSNNTLLYWQCDLSTSPLVLSELGLFDPDVTRYVGTYVNLLMCPEIEPGQPYKLASQIPTVREALNIPADDIVLGILRPDDDTVYDPIKWLREQLQPYLENNDE